MISIARTFGAPLTVPAGSVARRTSIGDLPVDELAGHLRREVHHVAVLLERHQLVDVDACRTARTAADVVCVRASPSIMCSATFLRVSPSARPGHPAVVVVVATSAAGARDRAADHLLTEEPAQSSARRAADDRDVGMAEEVHVRARVHLAEAPVEVVTGRRSSWMS
jgi:hypothetical protein